MKTEKKYLIYGIGLVLIVLIGVTFAYFTTQIIGDRKEISVTTADLKVIFTNGESITGEEIEPGWSITKTFSVENKTKGTYKYNIVIEDIINTFKTEGYLVYKITSTNDGYNMSEFVDVPKSTTATDTVLAYSVEIPVGVKQEYTIEIKYINSETEDQSMDMASTLSGNLYISEGTIEPTLYAHILADNPTVDTRTDFSVTNVANTTGTIYSTNATEDGSIVYYYSGNTTNNWVKFGGFYWRIIRTNEDGSVRLLYAGTSPDTTEGYIGTSAFDEGYDNPMYVGYMYGTFGSLANNRTNVNDSTIKQTIDTWYENNLLTNYDKYLSKTAIYCNDRSIGSETNGSYINFASLKRLTDNKTPTYKCGDNGTGELFESTQAVEDKFSTSVTDGGNGQLKYPIALMTADEVAFAGGVYGTSLSSPYAWYYTNSIGESITNTNNWWTISPFNFMKPTDTFCIDNSDNLGTLKYQNVSASIAVRPSVSLKSCANWIDGDGTPDSPYIVSVDTACAGAEN